MKQVSLRGSGVFNGGAILWFGNDRNVYYYDGDGDVIDDDDCVGYTYLVLGPLDIRKFGTSCILDLKMKQDWDEERVYSL